MTSIYATTRLRPSPYYESTLDEGVTSFSPYNQMLMPTGYGDPEGEYRRLTQGVAQWDVACERQVEISGPDAAELAQILTLRDISKLKEGQGRYVAICNHDGVILNDPIILKLAEDRYWFSIADSDVGLWAQCVAAERGLNVRVHEPDVSPMAVQGPLAEDVIASIFGDWVRQLSFFGFADAEIDNIPLKIARSGWSKQGGFELYLMDGSRGNDLWRIVREAGQPWGIGPGNPNASERIESGLLSWGGDTDDATNPLEVRMERFVDVDLPDHVIGAAAIAAVAAQGTRRHQLGVILSGSEPMPGHIRWHKIMMDGEVIGDMTNGTWSYKLEQNIGFGLVSVEAQPGQAVQVNRDGELVDGYLCNLPFTDSTLALSLSAGEPVTGDLDAMLNDDTV